MGVHFGVVDDCLELNLNASVFTPFTLGTYGCVGKNLALMEIRNVMTSVITRFDIKFATPKSKNEFIEGQQDGWVLRVGKLDLVFEERKSVEV